MIVDQKSQKQIVGAYLIDIDLDGTKIGVTKKPNFFRRIMMRLFFGWKWVTLEKLKANKK